MTFNIPFLFSGTVADNIRYAKPEASDEEVFAAALHLLSSSDLSIQLIPLAEAANQSNTEPDFAPHTYTLHQVFVYHYTSGSTCLPKAAMHSQENLIQGGIIYEDTFHIGSTDHILAAVPILHSFGMVEVWSQHL